MPADKYDSIDPLFDEEHNILHNKLGIIDSDELEKVESESLVRVYETLPFHYSDEHQFSVSDIRQIHRIFLGDIFDWAGKYRVVDISSADIRWCHAQYIPKQMEEIEKWLQSNTPFNPTWSRQDIIQRIAEIHGELIIVHPFRDGNGRVTRVLCDLLLMQAQILPIRSHRFYDDRELYFEAIRQVWQEASYQKLSYLLDAWVVDSARTITVNGAL